MKSLRRSGEARVTGLYSRMSWRWIAWMLVALSLVACGNKGKQHKAAVSQVNGPLKVTLTGSHSAAISWTASTTLGVQYNIYRNGTMVGTTAATTYTDSSLPASTTFGYQVSSVCVTCVAGMAGESTLSASVNVTTPPDVTPPPPPPPPPGKYPYSPGFNPQSLGFAYTIGGTVPTAGTTHVIDTSICPPPAGVPTCTWPTTIASDSAWLSATPVSGTTAFYISVKVNPAGLGAGTYHGNIIATIAQFTTPTKALPVTLVVTGAVPPPPPPPPAPTLKITCTPTVNGNTCVATSTGIAAGTPYTVTMTEGGLTVRATGVSK